MPRAMDARRDGIAGEGPADAQATTSSDDGEQHAGQDGGVDFGSQQSFSGLGGGGDLGRPRPRHLFGSAGRRQGRDQTSGRSYFPGMEHDHAGGVVDDDDGPRAPPGRQGPDDEERPPAVVFAVRVDLQFRHVNGGAGAMRSAALLAMFLASTALVGAGETGVSGLNQFRALMVWLGGCIGVFLWIRSRR